MAAAITLTIEAAIIYGSGHYPNDKGSHSSWQRPLPQQCSLALGFSLPCTSGPPAPARTPGEFYCSLLGRLSMAAAITLTMGVTIIYGSGHYPNDRGGH